MSIKTNSIWRKKHKTLNDYYDSFDPEYFEFDKNERTVDPDETVDDYNKYDANRQRIEIAKCALSFSYFCTKYVKILHPRRGLVPFILYKYQRFVINEYENNRFNIIRKFRQGGLTTVTEIWGMWRCLFKLDQQIMFLSKTDREAIAAGEIVNKAAQNLPKWLQPSKEGKWNDHTKQFYDQGSNMHFFTPEAARGRAITYLILDEAAFIPNMEEHWKAMYPTISTGGNAIVVSTVNGLGNWYQETFYKARDKSNDFNIIDLKYTQHPEYHNDKWVREQKAQLGQKGWQQEVLGDFLGSGETYIPSNIIGELQQTTNNNEPRKKIFKQWVNTMDVSARDEDDWTGNGAMWIWKDPQEGHEYILGVDCAEGVGDDGDSSCIQVIDQATLEQVAEFYSNIIQTYKFAKVINDVATVYNNGLVVVEGNGLGSAVLNSLEHEHAYDNIYYDSTAKSAKNAKPGIKITTANRIVILEALQRRLMSYTIRINSSRFVDELNTLIYNRQTGKVEATKGHHDDAIMALCFAVFVRDSVLRDVPMGAEVPREMETPYKNMIYEEIKKEIMGAILTNDLLETHISNSFILPDDEENVVYDFGRRKNHALLTEFGWAWLFITCYYAMSYGFGIL